MAQNVFEKFLLKAGSVPGIQINRQNYLRKTFEREYGKKLDLILLKGPLAAGISDKDLSRIANQAIRAEAMKVTTISAGTGVFGGAAMVAAVPVDIVQFYGHLFRIMQKLMYLYGWTEDIFDADGELDDVTVNILVLYMGLMFGVEAAGTVLAQIAKTATKRLVRDIPVRVIKALVTKQAFREGAKKIVKLIGVKTTAKVALVAGSKAVPVVGAVTSGGITAIFFIPMAKRLKNYLEKGEIRRLKNSEDDLESLLRETESF